jgi:26S proteasome regulatory subunit N1
VLDDPKSNMEVIGVTAVALGQIFVGTCDGDVTSALVSIMMSKTKAV